MPDVLIRNLDASTVAYWKRRASQHSRSLQAEMAEALRLEEERDRRRAEFDAVVEETRRETAHRPQTDSALLLREDRER